MSEVMSDEAALAIFNREVGIDTDPGDETAAVPVDTPVDTPADHEAADRPRNPDGTFAPAPQPYTFDPAALDDETRQFLDNNAGGDPLKAIQLARELQSSRRDHETEMARLKAIEDSVAALNEPEPVNPASDEWANWIDEVGAPNAAEWARQNGQPAVFDAAMEAWYDVQPRQASAYEFGLREQALRGEIYRAAEPQANERAYREVAQEFPEIQNAAFVQEVLNHPQARWAAQGIQSHDPQVKADALRAIGVFGRGLLVSAAPAFFPEIAQQQVAPTGTQPAAQPGPPQPDPRQLAHVATAGFSPARATPSKADQHQALFRQLVGNDNFADQT